MVTRGLTFGGVASAYERYRPGYPADLVDEVLTYAERPVLRALEVGAGTGKATRVFAERDIALTATDPDAAMLHELRAPTVSTVRASFEDVLLDSEFDLVFAAAAMHWTAPVGRWERVAALLVPRGTFASFGGAIQLADPGTEELVQAAYAPFLFSDHFPSPDGTAPDSDMHWPGSELEQSELFTDVRQSVIARRFRVSAVDYLGHLSTVSAYLELPDSVRQAAFTQIGSVLPAQVEVAADIILHLARRVP